MSRSSGKPVIEFDHLSARYAADPLSVYREMRSRCPVAWTDAHDGFWVTSTYADVFMASRDDATFSSKDGVVIPSESGLHLLPIEVDPPELRQYRRAMNPAFNPRAVARLVPEFGRLTAWCIDQVIESGEIDLVEDLRYSNIGTANGWHRLPARFTPSRRAAAPAPGPIGRGGRLSSSEPSE